MLTKWYDIVKITSKESVCVLIAPQPDKLPFTLSDAMGGYAAKNNNGRQKISVDPGWECERLDDTGRIYTVFEYLSKREPCGRI